MGQAADDAINGFVCEICGCFFDDMEEPGYPRTCYECGGEDGHTI